MQTARQASVHVRSLSERIPGVVSPRLSVCPVRGPCVAVCAVSVRCSGGKGQGDVQTSLSANTLQPREKSYSVGEKPNKLKEKLYIFWENVFFNENGAMSSNPGAGEIDPCYC